MSHKLFVYGTLKKGHRLNFLLQKGMFMGKYETVDSDFRMENYFDAFPVVYRDPEGKKIKGELYEIPTAVYEQVLAMEKGAGYDIIMIQIQEMDDKSTEQAIMFIYPSTQSISPGKQPLVKDEGCTMEWVRVS